MLQLLLERGQSYADLASLLGVDRGRGEDPSPRRAHRAGRRRPRPQRRPHRLSARTGRPDRQGRRRAPPEGRSGRPGARHRAHAEASSGGSAGRAPAAAGRGVAAPAPGLHPPAFAKAVEEAGARPKESADGEPRPPRTTLSRRQTQGIVVAACATVLVAVGVLAIAGVFSSGSSGSTTPTTSNPTPPSGTVQGYPLLPIAAANSKAQGAKLDSNGNFEDSIPIPTAVQSILPNVQAVAITLANNTKVANRSRRRSRTSRRSSPSRARQTSSGSSAPRRARCSPFS